MMHKWHANDDIVAFYLYKYGRRKLLPSTIEEISEKLGMSTSAMKMRMANFQYLDSSGQKGLSHPSIQSREVYKKYKDFSEPELREIVKVILSDPMVQNMTTPETITVDDKLINKLKLAIDAALEYERATYGKRKLGITGEVGELLACHQLGLKLVLDSRSAGFDAVDKDGLRVQIKTRRSESEGLPRDAGRMSSFSKHEFDYALLVLLDHKYQLCEIWRANYDVLEPIIEEQKRRDPHLSSFKHVGEKIFDNNCQNIR